MSDWRGDLRDIARELGGHARRVARAVDRAVDRDPYHIAGYRGYASRWRALVLGRVLQDEGVVAADASHTSWQNLLNMVRRMESDPLAHARVRASLGGAQQEVVANDEGFLHEWMKLPTPLDEDRWHSVELELVLGANQPAVRGTASVLVPSPAAAFGVISDMDDTVLQSEVTDFLRAARLMLLENARTRLPFPGVAAFYRALENGGVRKPRNPIFYVSSSPWNLYDVIADFLDAQKIPSGPLVLRDWDLSLNVPRHGDHKLAVIGEILDAYPWLRFILVGDSGHEDPEIYSGLVTAHPGRILAVYIRNVSRSAARSASIAVLAEQVTAAGSTLLLADDTLTVAKHAAAQGWIDAAALSEIGDEASRP